MSSGKWSRPPGWARPRQALASRPRSPARPWPINWWRESGPAGILRLRLARSAAGPGGNREATVCMRRNAGVALGLVRRFVHGLAKGEDSHFLFVGRPEAPAGQAARRGTGRLVCACLAGWPTLRAAESTLSVRDFPSSVNWCARQSFPRPRLGGALRSRHSRAQSLSGLWTWEGKVRLQSLGG